MPIPCFSRPSPGTDREAVIHDLVQNKTYEFHGVSGTSCGGWSASWGGAELDDAFVITPYGRQWPRPDGVHNGTQASGLAFIPGLILAHELRAGVIAHAIHIGVPQSCAAWKWPATRTDAGSIKNNPTSCIALGQVWKLPAAIDISTLPPFVRLIAQAAKTHGLVASDQTHGPIAFRVENWQRPW